MRRKTPLYTKLDIEYQQVYSGPYEDVSTSKIIAGIKEGRITGFGRPVIDFSAPKEEIEKLWSISQKIWYRDYLTDGLSEVSKFLLRKNILARPTYHQVIDLTKSESELHEGLRKSYKSLVNKGDSFFIDSDIGWLYASVQKLHHRVYGKATRSNETWAIQTAMMRQRELFALVEGDPEIFSAGLFYHNGYVCYYGVGCSLPGVDTHALVWKAILHAKEIGCKLFEIGEQYYNGDEKLQNIAKFKRGFGGRAVVRLDFDTTR